MPDSDISFVSSGRPSTDRLFPSIFNQNYNSESSFSNPRMSYSSDTDGNYSFESLNYGRRSVEFGTPDFSSFSHDSDGLSSSASQNVVRTSNMCTVIYQCITFACIKYYQCQYRV